MQATLWLPVLAGILAGGLNAATITFEVTPLGGNNFHYSYGVSGISFQQNQGFDIRFDHTLYPANALSNGTVGPGFTLFLLQPNNTPGTDGDFEAVANVNNPSNAGPFGVDVVYSGVGQPGPQLFTIDQFDANGNITAVLQSGVTQAVPEPSTLFLTVFSLGIIVAGQRKFRSLTSQSSLR